MATGHDRRFRQALEQSGASKSRLIGRLRPKARLILVNRLDCQQRITPKINMILRHSIKRRRISVSHQDQAEKDHEVAEHNCRSQERKVPRQLMGETRMKCMV